MTTLKSNLLKKGKKGFTLTELAIVIAVIAILIAVLVPTFTSVITNARKTTAAEDAKGVITAYTLETYQDLPDGAVIVSGDYYFEVSGGNIDTESGVNATFTTTGYVEFDGWITYTQYADNDSITLYFTSEDAIANADLCNSFTTLATAVEAAALNTTNTGSSGANLTTTATYYAAVTVGSETSASSWFVLTYVSSEWTAATSTEKAYNDAAGTPTSAQSNATGYSVVYRAATSA